MSHTQYTKLIYRYRGSETKNFYMKAKFKDRIIYSETIALYHENETKKPTNETYRCNFVYENGERFELSNDVVEELADILQKDFKTPIEMLLTFIKL